jgi:hypothetical protein
MHNLIPVLGSVVFKFRTDATGAATGNQTLFCWNTSRYPSGDHVALTPDPVWENNDARQLIWIPTSGASLRATNFIGSDPVVSTANSSMPVNNWYVVTVAWNMAEFAVRLKIGAGTTLMDTMTPEPTVPAQQMENRMRVGYLKPGGAVSPPAPQYLAMAEMAFFHDDILVNQPTEAAALVASWT